MKLVDKMTVILPEPIKHQCIRFVTNYKERNIIPSLAYYTHDGKWKETNNELKVITKGILNVL